MIHAAHEILIGSTLSALQLQEPLCIERNDTIDVAMELLKANNIGCLVVTNPDTDMMEGILTERDIVLKLTGREENYPNFAVDEIMTSKVETVKKGASIGRALHMMAFGGYRHLPVIHSSKFPTAILSARDIVDFVYMKLIATLDQQAEEETSLRDFLQGNVSQLNPQKIISLSKHTPVSQALQHLQRNNIGCLAVSGENGQLEGVFGERDYILKVVGHSKHPTELKLFEVMTREPDSGSINSSVSYCFQIMHKGGFRHIPLTNRKSEPEFMVSIRDFMSVLASNLVEDLEAKASKKKK